MHLEPVGDGPVLNDAVALGTLLFRRVPRLDFVLACDRVAGE
jgi:hypothetical protein